MTATHDLVMADPFAVLGVPEDADDATIKQRYLALVRAAPPDREPERFQAYRRAFEAVQDARARAELRLLHSTDAALRRLYLHCLQAQDVASDGRATERSFAALLADGLKRVGWE